MNNVPSKSALTLKKKKVKYGGRLEDWKDTGYSAGSAGETREVGMVDILETIESVEAGDIKR